MSSQSHLIKFAPWTQDEGAAAPGVFARLRRWSAAFVAREPKLQLWRLDAHLLRDLGYEQSDAEIAKLRDPSAIALGHLGFASLPFQNRARADRY